jgi:hypothetical protein
VSIREGVINLSHGGRVATKTTIWAIIFFSTGAHAFELCTFHQVRLDN